MQLVTKLEARQSRDRLFTRETTRHIRRVLPHNNTYRYIQEIDHTTMRVPSHRLQKMTIPSQSSEFKGPHTEQT